MKSDNILINEYKNGNKEALNILINKYLYLPELKLSAFNYDEKYEEDLLQIGYEKLIILIKDFINKDLNLTLSTYLHTGLYSYYCTHISLFDVQKEIPCGINYVYVDEDFIDNIESKEILKIIKDMIFKTNYFTIEERLSLIAKYGLIAGYSINNTQMSKIMNCSPERVRQRLLKAKEKLNTISNFKTHKIYEEKNNFNTDIFSFLQTSDELVLYFIKKLSEDEITLLKKVWSEDLKHLKDLDNIDLNDDEIIEFLKIMRNLQVNILDASEDEMSRIMHLSGARSCYYIRR